MRDRLIILLPINYVTYNFGGTLKISRIAVSPQQYHGTQIILNLTENVDMVTSCVNKNSNREFKLSPLRFWSSFPRIMQDMWEADPLHSLVHPFKLDIIYMNHWVAL